ncbi:MAG: hypothetical protein ACK55Z_20700, partial [bacterium]
MQPYTTGLLHPTGEMMPFSNTFVSSLLCFYIIRDEATGRLLVEPEEVIEQVRTIESKALSPDPTLAPGAPFPWYQLVTNNQKHTVPMISGRIT